MLGTFTADAEKIASSKRSVLDIILGRPSLKELETQLNTLIDYLSNSRDKVVVGLLNEYPFKLTHKKLQSVIHTSQQLYNRIQLQSDTYISGNFS